MKIKKTYYFAFWSSVYITVFTAIALFLLAYFFLNIALNFGYILLYLAIVFTSTFIITQFRLEKFIFKRIKKIYDSVSILDTSDFNKTPITTDIDTLSRDVQTFAKNKQLQIKNLNLREDYRREFLGNISHELKTPLFTVQGYLLTLADGAINDKKISKKYIKRANKGVERLIAIVKDLDMISKLESADLHLNKEPFDVVALVKNIFELLEMKAKKRNITLTFNKKYRFPIMAIGDEEKIEQVLINLLVNSIKYGKIDGITTVSIESLRKDKLLVKVKDDGEGIEAKHLPRIFERFYRVDSSRSREQGGSGLGLAIVKHIIEAHDEAIFAESEFKKGSTFSFTLEKFEQL
mgnify:FL=1